VLISTTVGVSHATTVQLTSTFVNVSYAASAAGCDVVELIALGPFLDRPRGGFGEAGGEWA
jgi:hypothetical protein